MKKTIILIAILALGLLTSFSVKIQTVKAAFTPGGAGFPLCSGINITSPANTTYLSGILTLNVSVRSMPGPIIYSHEMVYSLDGKDNATIPVTSTFVPVEATRQYANGTTAKVISIFSYYLISGCIALPELIQGSYNLTVYARYERINDANTNWPALLLDKNTVNFTINNGIPPVISNLSLENKTYTQNSLPLNFTTDKATSWMGYCLDGKTNVTITGNTTLTGLTNEPHNLTIYTNDTIGNMGNSENINFQIYQPATFQTEFTNVMISVLIVGIIIASITIVLKERAKTKLN